MDRFGNPARSILLHVAVEQLKNLGTAAAAFWKQDYVAVAPDEMTLQGILGDSRLAQRLPKIPGEPQVLTPQQQPEVRQRVAMGEAKDRIAQAYRIDVETVKRLARGAA